MTNVLLRRYLAALGLSGGALTACASGEGGGQTPTTEPTATETPPVETAAVTATAAETAVATAVPTQTVAPAASGSIESWSPRVAEKTAKTKPTPPEPRMPRCPEGNFCIHEADAKGSGVGEAPYEKCAALVPRQPNNGPNDRLEGDFNPIITKRERTETKDACCYHWVMPCPGGRPLMVDGAPRIAPKANTTAWDGMARLRAFEELEPAAREALATHYLVEAGFEHASVAAFARVSLSLLAVGAPPELLVETHRAALDEVEHARAMYRFASACRAAPVGPGPLDVEGARPTSSIVELAEEAFLEGCVGEVAAALVLREEAARALDEEIACVLDRMAGEEERHAELAWRTVAWALSREPEAVGAALMRAKQRVVEEISAPTHAGGTDGALPGVTTAGERTALRRQAIAEVVMPCLAALVARDA